ncbi:GFA family protein [Halioxenophilus sp. WMMB6]|uniref:GFA family protein n=1 Tax=Halioxenophilus sp. WMMB6 TaxID=3073815 RepID=UPI00295F3891|nr:GFA family protein [Halioxenophilus sp. WMMB6]
MNQVNSLHTGGCSCGQVRYQFSVTPLIVHCCHCSFCQRETGTAFALNALVEAAQVAVEGELEKITTPSQSGSGQIIVRCPKCRVALWSHYHPSGPNINFMRVGTLDEPGRLPPDIHIYTSTKLPWVVLPEGAARADEFYNPKEVWSAATLQRFRAARG